MKKLYCKALVLAVFLAAVSSCKIDAPVLPKDILIKDPADGGTGTNPGTNEPVNTIGLPIGPTNTVRMQLNTATGIQTYDQVNFNTVLGVNNISGRLNSDVISIGYVGDKTGTFDLLILNIGDYSLVPGEPGKIEITVSSMDAYSKGTIKGGYEANVVNSSGATQFVRGSFNIKQ
ncbi:hypothetical protein D0C36_10790 [Mucilaginibacter conchicola]|uniref:Uncharacterized protein n=1 Tax=Mucilaginibacter conchicola TaxID=2303333 RepID=A0A372NTK3_9SPHI|nr:hypothetical protein [Mucilaginibacter conchicola]RFZ91927.1 hypothetical protein D0C36_10790 [Mucilaginibacter conchicola]